MVRIYRTFERLEMKENEMSGTKISAQNRFMLFKPKGHRLSHFTHMRLFQRIGIKVHSSKVKNDLMKILYL